MVIWPVNHFYMEWRERREGGREEGGKDVGKEVRKKGREKGRKDA